MIDLYDFKEIAKPICKALWVGDDDVLPQGSIVEVLALDGYPHIVDGSVPARMSAWVRWTEWAHAGYRSCDICDLEVIEDDNG